MSQQIELTEFQQWLGENQKILYASSSKEKKGLFATTRGSYEVWKNNEMILETMQPFNAVEKYNSI